MLLMLLIVTTTWQGMDATTAALPYSSETACGEALRVLPLPPESIGQCVTTGVLSSSPVPKHRPDRSEP